MRDYAAADTAMTSVRVVLLLGVLGSEGSRLSCDARDELMIYLALST